MIKFLAVLLAACVLTSNPAIAAAARANPETAQRAQAWLAHFGRSPQLLSALNASEIESASLAYVLARTKVRPEEIAERPLADQARSLQNLALGVAEQALTRDVSLKQNGGDAAALQEQERVLGHLAAIGGLSEDMREAVEAAQAAAAARLVESAGARNSAKMNLLRWLRGKADTLGVPHNMRVPIVMGAETAAMAAISLFGKSAAPPIIAAGCVGLEIYRSVAQRRSQNWPLDIQPFAIVKTAPENQGVVHLRPFSAHGDYGRVSSAVLDAAKSLSAAGFSPDQIKEVRLVGRQSSSDGRTAPEYFSSFDARSGALTLTIDTILARWNNLRVHYLEVRGLIQIQDVALAVLFREAAKNGTISGRTLDFRRVVAAGFTEEPNLVIGAPAILEAARLLGENLSAGSQLKIPLRSASFLAACALIFFGAPRVIGSILQFHEGIGILAGLFAAAETTLLSFFLGLGLGYALKFAAYGSLKPDIYNNSSAAKEETAFYLKLSRLPFGASLGRFLFGAGEEEWIFRWGAYNGFAWWFSWLSFAQTETAVLAAAASTYLFAQIHGGASRADRFVGLFLSGGIYASIYALSGSLIWPILTHFMTNALQMAVYKIIFNARDPHWRRDAIKKFLAVPRA